jgi:hypothetical protein
MIRIFLILTLSLQLSAISCQLLSGNCFGAQIKQPNVAGMFYPDNAGQLSGMIDEFIKNANPEAISGDIFALICPHAGYGFSGQVAAFGYKLIRGKPYRTVVVIGTSHYYGFNGVSVYPEGIFRTPLGDIKIDAEFAQKLLNRNSDITFEPLAFQKEHSVEVQLPFLQRTLTKFKIVPIVMGDCTFATCQKLADLLREVIGDRKDVLVVASTDLYHGYDYDEANTVDNLTLTHVKNMDASGLYSGLRDGQLQMCGGFGVVATILVAQELGHNKIKVLEQTDSAIVTGKKIKGIWTVGYAACVIDAERSRGADQEKGAINMLNKNQRSRLIEIARSAIENYLKIGKKIEITETDPVLTSKMGAFVTLQEHGELRGCIGNLVGSQPVYLTVRDMAIEAAVGDPRFMPVKLPELKDIKIEISVLSPLERVDSADKIKMGTHGVLIRRGFSSGVFLPQVATETGWSKEEFLSNLCSHKAGLPADAWKDKSTEIYIFTAEVFSENSY